MKTIVFGATGYLGSHVAEQLVLAGHDVTCVVRASSNIGFLETLVQQPVEGSSQKVVIETVNFSDDEALTKLIDQGCTVFNCVADTRMFVSDNERRVIELALTGRIFKAALHAKAKRFIQLSTVMIYGFDRPFEAVDENFPPNPKYSYSRIAQEREQGLLELQQGTDLELIILRPSNTLGKRDASALPNFLESHAKGIFPVIGGGDWHCSCMDARDVGRAMEHLLHVDVQRPEIYLVTGYEMTWLDLKAQLDQLLEKPTRLFNIPRALALFIGRIMEMVYSYGSEPALTRFSVDVISSHTLFDDTKICETGFKSRYSLAETLKDAIDITV